MDDELFASCFCPFACFVCCRGQSNISCPVYCLFFSVVIAKMLLLQVSPDVNSSICFMLASASIAKMSYGVMMLCEWIMVKMFILQLYCKVMDMLDC